VVPIRLAKRTCAGRLMGPGMDVAFKISGTAYPKRAGSYTGSDRSTVTRNIFVRYRDI